MGELADAVREVINPNAKILRARDYEIDDSVYSPTGNDFEELMGSIGLSPMNLMEQIENAKRGFN
jgi:hypothetical protein